MAVGADATFVLGASTSTFVNKGVGYADKSDGSLQRLDAAWGAAANVAQGLYARSPVQMVIVGDVAIVSELFGVYSVSLSGGRVTQLPNVRVLNDGSNRGFVSDGSAAYALANETSANSVLRIAADGSVIKVDVVVPPGLDVGTDFRLDGGYLYFPTSCVIGDELQGCPEAGVYRVPVTGGTLARVSVVPSTERGEVNSVAVHGTDVYFTAGSVVYASSVGSSTPARVIASASGQLASADDGVVVAGEKVTFVPKNGGPARTLSSSDGALPRWEGGWAYWTSRGPDYQPLVCRVPTR